MEVQIELRRASMLVMQCDMALTLKNDKHKFDDRLTVMEKTCLSSYRDARKKVSTTKSKVGAKKNRSTGQ